MTTNSGKENHASKKIEPKNHASSGGIMQVTVTSKKAVTFTYSLLASLLQTKLNFLTITMGRVYKDNAIE
jgi:hypothetical protein